MAAAASSREDAMLVVRRLRDSGHVAYFAGGCVRDLLLGATPKDFDVATDARPDRVRSLFPRTQAVGAAFGVILVRQNQSVIEVATFRSDGVYTDGRRPDAIEFTTPEQDAQRRDFTINGLFYDPFAEQVIDYVGGQADLASRQIRAIGDAAARFHEDHLRLLRAVRFASRLGFTIEPQTAEAISREAKYLPRISPERIAEELRHLITPSTRNVAAAHLLQFKLLPVLMRFVDEPVAAAQTNPLDVFERVDGELIPFGLALAALLLSWRISGLAITDDPRPLLEPAEIKRLGRAMRLTLRISNHELDDLVGSLSFGHLIGPVPPRLAALRRFLATPASSYAMRLMRAVRDMDRLRLPIDAALARLEKIKDAGPLPAPLLTGDDLTAAGYPPGPRFKPVLDQIYDEQLEDMILDQAAALDFANRLMRAT